MQSLQPRTSKLAVFRQRICTGCGWRAMSCCSAQKPRDTKVTIASDMTIMEEGAATRVDHNHGALHVGNRKSITTSRGGAARTTTPKRNAMLQSFNSQVGWAQQLHQSDQDNKERKRLEIKAQVVQSRVEQQDALKRISQLPYFDVLGVTEEQQLKVGVLPIPFFARAFPCSPVRVL